MVDTDNELKHWGILNMKWGIRRFQNPDGSLTPEGRERYNVGPARTKGYERAEENSNRNTSDNYDVSKKKKEKEHNNAGPARTKGYERAEENSKKFQNFNGSLTPLGRLRYGASIIQNPSNVGNHMSDDELKNMTYRYRKEADFYRARNDYIKAENEYKQLTTPTKKQSQFLNKVFVQPLENAMAKNVEFGFLALGASFVESHNSKYADEYLKYVFRANNSNNKNNKNDNNNDNNDNDKRNNRR